MGLQPYDLTIIYRKGRDHVVPDFLSRSVPVNFTDAEDFLANFSGTSDKWYTSMLENIESHPDRYPQWRAENNILYKYVRCPIPELYSDAECWKIVVPKDRRNQLTQKHHEDVRAGHVGTYKTYWKLHHRYYWPKMRSDVA